MRKSSLAVAVFAPLSIALAAPNAPTDDDLATLVVAATRIPTPELDVASSITVISADEIAARQVRTLPDLLKEVPGLNLVQTGGSGGQTSVFMRGTNSNHTKVLIDGIDLGDPSNPGGAFDLGTLLTQDIQTVEVLRGPQSGLYGSDAIGGVINIITKSGSGPAQFNAGIEAGSFDTFNQAGSVSGSLDQFHYVATLQHYHAGATPVTPLDLLPPGQARIDDYDDNLTASTKLGLDVTDRFDLGLVARYTDSHLRITGDNFATFPATPDASQSDNNTLQYYTRAAGHLSLLNGAFDQTVGAAYNNVKSSQYSPDNPAAYLYGERVKFDWQGILKVAATQQLLLGAEHQRDEITQPIAAATNSNSGYAELQSSFAGRLFDTISVRYDDNDRFGSQFTYRVAPTYLMDETGTKLKASVGTGFKAPSLSQLFQNFPEFDFFGNPSLRPETSVGYDAGFEQSLAADNLRFGGTYFHINIKNLIDDNADFTSLTNVGRAVTEGVESFVSYRPVESLILRMDYTYLQATDEILHEELLRRPKHKGSLNAAWQATSRFSLNATLLSVSSWIDGNRDFSIPRLTAPGYTTVDLAGSYELTPHWAIFGRITNLFNRHYQNPDGFMQPTVGAFAGVKAKF